MLVVAVISLVAIISCRDNSFSDGHFFFFLMSALRSSLIYWKRLIALRTKYGCGSPPSPPSKPATGA